MPASMRDSLDMKGLRSSKQTSYDSHGVRGGRLRGIEMIRSARWSVILLTGAMAATLVGPGSAQERARDRRRFLSADTKTTDDPRRTPVDPAVPRGPDGSIVLRGGRIFDGTGAAAR